MTTVILDYQASVPSSFFAGTPAVTVPQTPTQLQIADLGLFLPNITSSSANNQVLLTADVGVRNLGPIFNNDVVFHIYRDGREIFNTIVGLQIPGPVTSDYNISFNTIDENVPFGFHIYQLTVYAFIQTAQSTIQVVGPITFSGLGLGSG
ncbi:exosporium protein C [Paenibacillus filicis]|uniref:Exosporium protein C n=1 Tax=Paenibacillus gyeongsangnamensis TaxID=3388067 RepID=A0ABT4Q2C6_9BACL|nr:exosporium protein C [Paenibacillus filicis]MCZ8511038.1 exosporium protein C [Paenibacillus filicis]